MSFFEELKRRNVVRVGVAYGIAAWVLLQVADLVLENIDAPSWVIQALMLIVLLGFIAALVIAWAYEMTPEGIKKEADVDRTQSIVGHTGKKLDRIIIGFLVLAVAVLLIDRSRTPQPVKGPDTFSESATPPDPLASEQKTYPAPLQDNSIAVLPFANRSLQQEDEFFTDGIHDDLLTQLAKVKDLKVISRTSMMKYKDTQLSIPEIAAELRVSTILEGGIQRAGARIRINAQLINVSNDQHLWAETFDREMTMENIFEIQSEIARQIVTAVRGELSEEESANLGNLPTDNLEAYEAYLRALALTNLPDYVQSNYINAEGWLKKAIELDPEYAQAWALLVVVHGQAAWIGYDASPERFIAAKMAVENAVKFGAGTPETLAAEGEYLYRITNDFAASVEKYQAAHKLAPGDASLLERLAVAQRRAGFFDEAINNLRKGMERDPGNSRTATLLTDTLLNIKQFAAAAPLIDDYIQKFPNAHDLKGQKARVFLYGFGDIQSARTMADSMPAILSNEYYQAMTQLPMIERDYQAVIDNFNIPEIKELSLNRGYMGDDYWHRGLAYQKLGNETAAIAEFDAAITILTTAEATSSQTDAFEQQYLALSYAGNGAYEDALRTINLAVEMFAAGGDAIFTREAEKNRALVLGMAGKHDESLAEIERLLESQVGITRWELHLHPQWDFFRDDERFNELIRPPNLEEANQ